MSARKQIIPVFIPHLGCPHDCVFCNQKRISGSLFPAGPEDVVREIELALGKLPAHSEPQLAFYGGSFTAIPVSEQETLLGAAKPYLDRGLISGVRLSTRPDAIDEAVLDRVEFYGVDTIELGAQSMIDDVLWRSGRGHKKADTDKASSMIKMRGFNLVLQMMTGLPGSSKERDIESAWRIASLSPDGVRIYPTVIIKDTELYDMWKRGEYAEHTVDQAVETCAEIIKIFENRGISIIRLGLNPTDELSGGSAAGGAYHPALGELVKGRIMLTKALSLLDKSSGKGVVLGVNRSEVSQMIGQHRCNVDVICESLGFSWVKVVPAEVKKGEIVIREIAK